LDLNHSLSFRDPDVFWYAPGGYWVMAVALPDDRKVNFYSSNDLKNWEYLSSFGPAGAIGAPWECPVLAQVPVEGADGFRKWVLICSMGPNAVQYFVGDFDGTRFVMDPAQADYLATHRMADGYVWESFEGKDFGLWKAAGTAFADGPLRDPKSGTPGEAGYAGRALCSSFPGNDEATGTLTSPAFTILKPCVNFLVGGGDYPGRTCVNLVVDGKVVRTTTGFNNHVLRWTGWNVADLIGRQARIVIVDRHKKGWGHIEVDHIMFADHLHRTEREHARWADWGPDFYAARVFRDYDRPGGPNMDVWIAWMGNWDYANDTPTSWGRGVHSLPRRISLSATPGGYLLRQNPLPALRQLRRGPGVSLGPRDIEGVVPLAEFEPARNTYELKATFIIERPDQQCGLNLCVGGRERVRLAYHAPTSNVVVDRRRSGDVSFSNRFPRQYAIPLLSSEASVTFHVFVDQSSIEVFVNEGQVTITAQVFPRAESTGIELFSVNGDTTLQCLQGWELSPIWPDP
jgi:sucrose-6-phosphate hydrolase SacC (GH32 family)